MDLSKNPMYLALKARYEAKKLKALANMQVFMKAPVGVAEHPNILETIEGELEKMSAWEDKLMVLNEYFGSIKHNKPKELLKD